MRLFADNNSFIKSFGDEGNTSCSLLCDARSLQKQCGEGLKYKNLWNGAGCFCNGSRCAKRKYL